jgi:TRAP-type C4-dicarboxylate transport system permease small subunit
MRAALNRMYDWSGYLAAFFLAMIGIGTVVQVVAREFGKAVEMTELAGFCMAASTFLGLAHALRHGTHIRVDLFAHRIGRRGQRLLEFWAALVGAATIGGMTVAFGGFAWQSWQYHDISPGLLAIPFWIPQSAVVLGFAILTIALIDDAIRIAQGGKPAFASSTDATPE